jgi:hypothetical protein
VKELRKSTVLNAQSTDVEIGDKGLLYTWKIPGDRFTVVVWRFRTVFAVVGAGELGKVRTLALARVQQRRIASALG